MIKIFKVNAHLKCLYIVFLLSFLSCNNDGANNVLPAGVKLACLNSAGALATCKLPNNEFPSVWVTFIIAGSKSGIDAITDISSPSELSRYFNEFGSSFTGLEPSDEYYAVVFIKGPGARNGKTDIDISYSRESKFKDTSAEAPVYKATLPRSLGSAGEIYALKPIFTIPKQYIQSGAPSTYVTSVRLV